MLAIGPIALLCISRTIEKGRIAGFAVGLGFNSLLKKSHAWRHGIFGFICRLPAAGGSLVPGSLCFLELLREVACVDEEKSAYNQDCVQNYS